MKFVCIGCAGDRVETAAVNGDTRVYRRDERFVQASRALMPMLDGALDAAGFKLKEAAFISVVIGPGSFTGIRIGVSAARAIAYALNLPVVAINSCELAAYNCIHGSNIEFESVLCATDAGNGYNYAAVYGRDVDEVYLAPCCMTSGQLVNFRTQIDEPCLIAADARSAPLLAACETAGEGIIDLSERRFREGLGRAYGLIEPLYIRKPQAEENLK